MAELNDIQVDISVMIGSTTMPVHQLLRMGRGAVIALETSENDQVLIMANDMPVARGNVVLIDERIGVEVTRRINRADLQKMA